MSDGSYPDDDEREERRKYVEQRWRAWAAHAQPCPCAHCYDIRAEREWRDDD
jgi:hypothetical protein